MPQAIKNPRFYVNVSEFMSSVGQITDLDSVYRTLPVTPVEYIYTEEEQSVSDISVTGMSEKSFLAILGHDISGYENKYYQVLVNGSDVATNNVINGGGEYADDSDYHVLQYDGFSIVTFDGTGASTLAMGLSSDQYEPTYSNVGSIILGTYYDMVAPNLSLTISREYGGTQEYTAHNGSSMSNTMWNSAPKWGNLGAWELEGSGSALSRSGRRTWQLQFSYMGDSDLWGSNQMLSYISGNTSAQNTNIGYESGDVSADNLFDYNLLSDDNFFSQVWHKTLGGTLPFIFQPDGDGDTLGSGNNNPDQFAICRFKDNSLKATRSSFNTYDISLSIEEVW